MSRIFPLKSFFFSLLLVTTAFGEQRELPDFPKFSQPDQISCGPTSASMFLKYYRVDAGISSLKNKAGTNWFSYKEHKVGMTHPGNLRDAIKAYGIDAGWYSGQTTSDLVSYVNQGRPPILLVRSGQSTWHYIVVIGYDDNGRRFRISDPSGGKHYWINADTLRGAWQFSHDLDGNYIKDTKCQACKGGGSLWTKCPTCSGSGKWKGPLGTWTKCAACSGQGKWSSNCPICGGDGKVGDFYRKAVETSGAVGSTVIVSKYSSTYVPWLSGKRYAFTCIRNELPFDVNYKYKWGNSGDFTSKKLAANSSSGHWWYYNYIDEKRSPDLIVNFDYDLSEGYQAKQYKLTSYATDHTSCNQMNNREVFKYQNNSSNRRIDLYHQD